MVDKKIRGNAPRGDAPEASEPASEPAKMSRRAVFVTGAIVLVLVLAVPLVSYLTSRPASEPENPPVVTAMFAATLAPFTAADSSCYDAPAPSGTNASTGPTATAAPPITFEEVTRAAGLCVKQSDWKLPPSCLFNKPTDVPAENYEEAGAMYGQCLEERMSGGAFVGDYDGDGRPDVYLTQLRMGAPGRLFHNEGGGKFRDVTVETGLARVEGNGNGAAWVDVDNDGRLDLVVTTIASDRYFLFHQNADRTFTEQGDARGVSLRDQNSDFYQTRRGFSVAAGDYDNDGYVDLFLTEWRKPADLRNRPAPHARLLHNKGRAAPGEFEDLTDKAGVVLGDPRDVRAQKAIDVTLAADAFRTASFSAAFVDLDNDGWPDLAVASDFGTSQLFWNNRDGTFREGSRAAGIGKEGNAMGSTFADLDGSGRLAWFVTAVGMRTGASQSRGAFQFYTGNKLYRNDGNREFTDGTAVAGVAEGGWGWGASFADFDLDGRPDLFMTNGQFTGMFFGTVGDEEYARTTKRLWWNSGGGRFQEIAGPAGIKTTAEGKGVAVADFDGDGKLDILTANNGGFPTLYRNTTASVGGSVRVNVQGTRSNRDGLGAVVRVTDAAGVVHTSQVGVGAHFLAQNEHTVTVGLGAGAGAAPVTVEVTWPASGQVTRQADVPADGTIEMVEPG